MDEDRRSTDEDHNSGDEESYKTDEDGHTAEEGDSPDENDHTADEDGHTTDDDDDDEDKDGEGGEYAGEYQMHSSEYTSGPGALLRNAMKGPGMKIVELRAKSGERWGVARARVQEKFSRAGATINYGVYSVTHPIHPIRRQAAKEAAREKKSLAADKRKQREARAHSRAAAKVAAAREGRISTLEEGVH